MASPRILALIFPFIALIMTPAVVSSVIQLPRRTGHRSAGGASYCESRRLAVETNNAGAWTLVPNECEASVRGYVTGEQYYADYEAIVDYAIDFAKTVKITGDGKNAWIFDVDETLLSNVVYYGAHGYGTEPFDEVSFNSWVEKGTAPAFVASLRLYNELKKLGFTIFLLTGRDEDFRSETESNLKNAGYSGWRELILRGAEDQGKTATIYKSERRMELVNKGYVIHGNVGDQWSDLLGYAVAQRSFKVPNPFYFVP